MSVRSPRDVSPCRSRIFYSEKALATCTPSLLGLPGRLRSAGFRNLQESSIEKGLEMVGLSELSPNAFVPKCAHPSLCERERAGACTGTGTLPRASSPGPATACISLGFGARAYTQPLVKPDEGPLSAGQPAGLGSNNQRLRAVSGHPDP